MPNKSNKNRLFTTREVQKYTNVSPRKIRWWQGKGLIKTGAPARKSWRRRRYTLQDIICILMIRTLRENGMSLQKISETVEKIGINDIAHPLAKLRFACLAHTIIVKIEGKYLEPLSGQMVIEQCLEEIRPKLERRRLAPAERSVERVNQNYEQKIAGF
jgi:DNA-binding transcriptional MerR regulator